MSEAESRASADKWRHWWPPRVVLLLTFASFYFAIGLGNFFATD